MKYGTFKSHTSNSGSRVCALCKMNGPPDQNNGRRTSTTVHTSTTTHGPTVTTTSYTTNSPSATVTTGPQSTTITHPTVTTTHQVPYPRPRSASIATQTERHPSIRIRRQRTEQSTHSDHEDTAPLWTSQGDDTEHDRRRSSPEPLRPQVASLNSHDDAEIRRQPTPTPMQTLFEEGSGAATTHFEPQPPAIPPKSPRRPAFMRQVSAISIRPRGPVAQEYGPEVVNMLDVIDPEVSTLTTLNNVQNSLFIPNLGWLYNRQPTYDLSQSSPDTSDEEAGEIGVAHGELDHEKHEEQVASQPSGSRPTATRLATTNTISSVLTGMSEGHNFAVLPHGASLPGWTPEEKAALNDHVRHLLHSRRARFKRSMRGFGRYVRKPVGFLVTLYSFLLTFWGTAWVLFLIGWISVGDRQAYFIEICDQILTALFCVVGIGFAPWRAVDTYHMIYVAYYAHRTWRIRRERGLPDLKDRNELPAQPDAHAWERGVDPEPEAEETVLTAAQQSKLEHHQEKLAKSHTFYKPHETTTHHAFSVRLLITIVVLLDCHSLFQMALGATTWGIYYKVRPKALTAVILSFSLSCNISAGITITAGDKKSRKKLIVEQMFRQGITEEALQKMRKERGLKVKGIGKQETIGEEDVRDI